MEKKRDLAIVLRTVPYQERHRIVTALTESHGLVSAIAKNSVQARRFGGTLEPFAASEWHFSERPHAELAILYEAQIKRDYVGLREDFERLSMASALNELMLRLAPQREPAPDLFKLHSNALAILEECSPGTVLFPLLNGYLAKLLQWSGNQPRIMSCLECQIPLTEMQPQQSLSCVIADAGWICTECRSKYTRHVRDRDTKGFSETFMRVSPAAVVDFLHGLKAPIKKSFESTMASALEHRELFHFLEALLIYHIPGFDRTPLKSLRFLGLESSVLLQAASPR